MLQLYRPATASITEAHGEQTAGALRMAGVACRLFLKLLLQGEFTLYLQTEMPPTNRGQIDKVTAVLQAAA